MILLGLETSILLASVMVSWDRPTNYTCRTSCQQQEFEKDGHFPGCLGLEYQKEKSTVRCQRLGARQSKKTTDWTKREKKWTVKRSDRQDQTDAKEIKHTKRQETASLSKRQSRRSDGYYEGLMASGLPAVLKLH
jgi:hypothetical protein